MPASTMLSPRTWSAKSCSVSPNMSVSSSEPLQFSSARIGWPAATRPSTGVPGGAARPAPVRLGGERLAGGDTAEHRDAGRRGRGGARGADATRDPARAADVARLLEQVQVVADPVGGRDPELATDLTDGRRGALLPAEALDERMDLAGAFIEHGEFLLQVVRSADLARTRPYCTGVHGVNLEMSPVPEWASDPSPPRHPERVGALTLPSRRGRRSARSEAPIHCGHGSIRPAGEWPRDGNPSRRGREAPTVAGRRFGHRDRRSQSGADPRERYPAAPGGGRSLTMNHPGPGATGGPSRIGPQRAHRDSGQGWPWERAAAAGSGGGRSSGADRPMHRAQLPDAPRCTIRTAAPPPPRIAAAARGRTANRRSRSPPRNVDRRRGSARSR